MDAETSWQVIAEQRRDLADLLEGLTAEQWQAPSLCAGWRVRDVAAHVALAPQAGHSLDKMQQLNAELARDREYLALLDKYKDCWLEGSMRDTLVAFAP